MNKSLLDKSFNNFINENILPQNIKHRNDDHNWVLSNENFSKTASTIQEALKLQPIKEYRPPKEIIRNLVGKYQKYPEAIGNHPDFKNLTENDYENHYIVSVFLDIKGSTKLATELSLQEVKFIKNRVITIAIDIFQALDGHIHRLQGDAVFAFFGRKDMKKSTAIIDSLNAVSIIQYFFSNVLAKKFEDVGLPVIKIRIGVDFGDDNKVLWSLYGIKNTSEITTTSIHTDLASKMQSKAPSNGVIFGDNIKTFLDYPDEFYSKKNYQKNGEILTDDYILCTANFNYKMWQLDWDKYLKSFLVYSNSSYPYKCHRDFNITCNFKQKWDSEYVKEYLPNSAALPKGMDLKFQLNFIMHFNYDTIEWRVFNRGDEAERENETEFDMPIYKNKTFCLQETSFKGHHYMRCTIKYQNRIVAQEKFGIFINDD